MTGSTDLPSPPGPPPVVRRRRRGKGTYIVVGVIVVVLVFVGIGFPTNWYGLYHPPTSPGTCPAGITLSGAGANFLLALIGQWQISYTSATSNQVNYNPDGAGAGITAFAESTVDFAATDEPLNVSEVHSLPGTTLTLPVTGGAVTIIYNVPGFSGPLRITGPQLAKIYLGTISNWDDPALAVNNSGLPNAQIITVHRLDAAGATYVFTNLLSDDSHDWASGPGMSISPTWPRTPGPQVAEKGNSALATYVSTTPDAIGYVDLADAVSKGVSIASVLNPAGKFIHPTVTDTQSAITNLSGQPFPSATGDWTNVSFVNSPGSSNYPVATLSYFLILQNPGLGYAPSLQKAQVLIQWMSWSITSGQASAHGLYYVNPPPKLLTQDASALTALSYNGASIPSCT